MVDGVRFRVVILIMYVKNMNENVVIATATVILEPTISTI